MKHNLADRSFHNHLSSVSTFRAWKWTLWAHCPFKTPTMYTRKYENMLMLMFPITPRRRIRFSQARGQRETVNGIVIVLNSDREKTLIVHNLDRAYENVWKRWASVGKSRHFPLACYSCQSKIWQKQVEGQLRPGVSRRCGAETGPRRGALHSAHRFS